jgi:hypothetical protein
MEINWQTKGARDLEKFLAIAKADVENYTAKLSESRDLLREIQIEIFSRNTGIRVGTKVRFCDGSIGIINRFSELSPVAKLLKKDGSIGKRESKIYSFQVDKLEIIKETE